MLRPQAAARWSRHQAVGIDRAVEQQVDRDPQFRQSSLVMGEAERIERRAGGAERREVLPDTLGQDGIRRAEDAKRHEVLEE